MNPMSDRDAHSIALHHLINDVKHVLDWVAAALIGATAFNAVLAPLDLLDHHYVMAGVRTLLAIAFGVWAHDTRRRARKYRKATR